MTSHYLLLCIKISESGQIHFDNIVLQYVLPMEVITAQSFGKWMHVFQTVVARDVPQVRISPQ